LGRWKKGGKIIGYVCSPEFFRTRTNTMLSLKHYDEITEDRENATMTTGTAARGEPNSVATNKSIYHASFLPRTIREMRGQKTAQP